MAQRREAATEREVQRAVNTAAIMPMLLRSSGPQPQTLSSKKSPDFVTVSLGQNTSRQFFIFDQMRAPFQWRSTSLIYLSSVELSSLVVVAPVTLASTSTQIVRRRAEYMQTLCVENRQKYLAVKRDALGILAAHPQDRAGSERTEWVSECSVRRA